MNRTHWFLALWTVVLFGYAFLAAALGPPELTVSRSLSDAGERHRILPYVIGSVLNGLFVHVFW